MRQPTMILWGEKDRALGTLLAEQSAALCENASVELIPGVAHWLLHEAPNAVNERLLNFLGAP